MSYEREKKNEKNLVKQVEDAGGLCPKFVSPALPGVPDRLVFLPIAPEHMAIVAKYFKLVEVKAPEGRLSSQQERRIADFRDLGFAVIVLDSTDMSDIL